MSPDTLAACQALSQHGRFLVFQNCTVFCFESAPGCSKCGKALNQGAWFEKLVAGREAQIDYALRKAKTAF